MNLCKSASRQYWLTVLIFSGNDMAANKYQRPTQNRNVRAKKIDTYRMWLFFFVSFSLLFFSGSLNSLIIDKFCYCQIFIEYRLGSHLYTITGTGHTKEKNTQKPHTFLVVFFFLFIKWWFICIKRRAVTPLLFSSMICFFFVWYVKVF